MKIVEQTLKVTNVLSDPTRFQIYNYIVNNHKEVTVQEIANNFDIHPNVARLHLSKLEDVNMLVSDTKKTGRGGRPSRLYSISNEVIKLNFPFRDYELLSTITLETMVKLGETGKQALYKVGKQYGIKSVEQNIERNINAKELTFEEKLDILTAVTQSAGFYPEIEVGNDKSNIFIHLYNCPFKEVAFDHQEVVCTMHKRFLQGMFESLFDYVNFTEEGNIFTGCESCSYKVTVK